MADSTSFRPTAHDRPRWRIARGLTFVAIVAVSAFIAYRWLDNQRAMAGRLPCPSNLRQIGQALFIYAREHGGRFPDKLEQLVGQEYVTMKLFVCPSSGDKPAGGKTPEQIAAELTAGGHLSYVYVGAGLTYDMSSDYVVAYDRPENHAPDGANVLFADGHVDWIAAAAMEYVHDEVAAGRLPVRLPTPGVPSATAPTTAPGR